MIITNLIGGLGNQLFQYAAGLAAARRAGTEVRVAVDMFKDYCLHQGYELTRVFALEPLIASEMEMRECLGICRGKMTRRVMGRFMAGTWLGGRVVLQPTVSYWSGFQDIGPNAYLQGYWQSEKFFDNVVSELRASLSFLKQPDGINSEFATRILSCNSVGVHVRRGDYLSNTKNKDLYAECTPNYYLNAIDMVLRLNSDAHFFVFSDDPAWARQLLAHRAKFVTVVDHNRGADSYNDLRLMSLCRHNIIANSTFSWWAAWLQERPYKLVIAPKLWLREPGLDIDIVPKRWIRL